MGRGRAKAKQQKVARELKYSSQHTDLDALQRELSSSGGYSTDTVADDDRDFDAEDDDRDDDGWDTARR